MEGGGIFVIMILVVGAFIGLAIYLDYLRKKFWREVAEEYGLQYSPGDPLDLVNRSPFSLFQQGHSQRVQHTAWGPHAGRPIILFDFSYKTGSGKNESTHSTSGLIVDMPLLGHALSVRPENVLDRFVAFFGFDDINFELEEFNRAFRVNCESKKFAYDIFHTGMMEFMLQHKDACFEWQGRQMLIHRYMESQFNLLHVHQAMETAEGFVKRLPEYLLSSPTASA